MLQSCFNFKNYGEKSANKDNLKILGEIFLV